MATYRAELAIPRDADGEAGLRRIAEATGVVLTVTGRKAGLLDDRIRFEAQGSNEAVRRFAAQVEASLIAYNAD